MLEMKRREERKGRGKRREQGKEKRSGERERERGRERERERERESHTSTLIRQPVSGQTVLLLQIGTSNNTAPSSLTQVQLIHILKLFKVRSHTMLLFYYRLRTARSYIAY